MTSSDDKRLLGARIRRAILPAAVVLALTGCIVIPVDYYEVGVRRNVSEKTVEKV